MKNLLRCIPYSIYTVIGVLLLTGFVLAAAIGPYTMVASSPVSAYRLNRWTGEMLFCLREKCARIEQEEGAREMTRSFQDISPEQLMTMDSAVVKKAIEADKQRQ